MSSFSRFLLVLTFLSMSSVYKVMGKSFYSPIMSTNGHLVDSFRRFAHHVTIETEGNRIDGNHLCGGSILSSQWIVTSGLCVQGSDRLHLHFEKLYYNSSDGGSFAIVVNRNEIYMHPTLTLDIALIRLPVELIFSDNLKPVTVSSNPVSQWEGKLAVMPGFDVPKPLVSTTTTTTTTTTSGPEGTLLPSYTNDKDIWTTPTEPSLPRNLQFISDYYPRSNQRLVYGMFRVLSNQQCQDYENSDNEFNEFDEFLQMCTENWIKSNESMSCWNPGNGLLVGWPSKPQLVGIYSVLLNNNCSTSQRGVFTNTAEYLPWIESVIDVAP